MRLYHRHCIVLATFLYGRDAVRVVNQETHLLNGLNIDELKRLSRSFFSEDVRYVCSEEVLVELIRLLFQTNQEVHDISVSQNLLDVYCAHFLNACADLEPDVVDDCIHEAKEKGGLVLRRCKRLYAHSRRLEISSNQIANFVDLFKYALRRFTEGLRQAISARASHHGHEGFSPLMSQLLEEFGGVYVFDSNFVQAINSNAFNNAASQVRTVLRIGSPRKADNGWVKYGKKKSDIRIYGSTVFDPPRIMFIIPNRKEDKARMDDFCARTPVSQYSFNRVA